MNKRFLYIIGTLAVIATAFVIVQRAVLSPSIDALHIDFTASPRTVAKFPYTAVIVSVNNSGQAQDLLILKRVEFISLEDHLVLSLEPDITLLPIGQEQSRLQEIDKQIRSLAKRYNSLSADEQNAANNLRDERIRLSEHIRANTFSYQNREKGLDLRNAKGDPLTPGDRVPLTLKITADLNGVTVTRSVVRYVEINP